MKKIGFIVILLFIFALVAGCFTMSVYAKVNPDTSISNFRVIIETTSTFYGLGGHQLRGNIDQDVYDYDEEWEGDKVTITVTAKKDIQSNDPVNWTIRRSDNRMIYFDSRFTSFAEDDQTNEYTSAMMNSISIHYYLEMPGKILSSNANTVENNKAEWHLQGQTISTPVRAESELPVTIPGFEAVLALTGIMVTVLVMYLRKY